MVNADKIDNEPATHDAFGTDLRLVRRMLDQGFGESIIGECLGITTNRARYAIIVATDSREGAPTQEQIAAECEAIQAGWTEEQAVAAKLGRDRNSSAYLPHIAKSNARRKQFYANAASRRSEHGEPPVYQLPNGRFLCKVYVRGQQSARRFDTREEAIEWGRSWLTIETTRQVGSCCRG